MKISIENHNDKSMSSNDKIKKPPSTKSFLSLCRLLALISTVIVILCIMLLCRSYLKFVLLEVEKEDPLVISASICLLFILVALPISIGYILLVVASGFLFGILRGLLLVIFGANFALLVAHNVLRRIKHHPKIYRFTQTIFAKVIINVISGPLSFKIIFCSRLTPIPFGLQNTIFALTSVTGRMYHIASMLGLLPAQCVGVYVGTTLRSVQDIFEHNHISSMTYVLASVQLILGASLMIWIGLRARAELINVLAEADNLSTKPTTFSVV